ncbi:hypothetical protein [Nitrospira sp. BLG_2]
MNMQRLNIQLPSRCSSTPNDSAAPARRDSFVYLLEQHFKGKKAA